MKKSITLLILCFVTVGSLKSQNCSCTIGVDSACVGDTVIVPVQISGWNNPDIASISISIIVEDTSILGFCGYNNWNPAISGIGTSCCTNEIPVSGTPGKLDIRIAWDATSSGVSLSSGTLVELVFVKKTIGTVMLNWNTALCEFSTWSFNLYNVAFNNGSVLDNASLPQAASISGNEVPIPGSTEVYCVIPDSGVSYFWTIPSGWSMLGGQGTDCITVLVDSISGAITVTPYNNCGNGFARSIYVNPLIAGVDLEYFENVSEILVYPNPFEYHFNIEFKKEFQKADVRILDYTGKILNTVRLESAFNTGIFRFDATPDMHGILICEAIVTRSGSVAVHRTKIHRKSKLR